jgi:hypothetical protein
MNNQSNDPYNEVVKLGPLAYFVLSLWVGRLNSQPATESALMRASGLSQYKVRTALPLLEAAGYALQGGGTWQLTSNVTQLDMFVGNQENLTPVIEAEFENPDPEPVAEEPKNVEPDGEKKFFSLEVKKESLKDSKEYLTTSTGEKIFSSDLLRACKELFGERPLGHSKQYAPDLLLGWMAQAYDQRRCLRHPARLIYNRMIQAQSQAPDYAPQKPEREYLVEPWKFLPAEFLKTVGLGEFAPEVEQVVANDDAPKLEAEPEPVDPSLNSILHGARTVMDTWQALKGQLQQETPKATFDNFLRDVRPRTYNDNVLTLEVANTYVRDWLAERLTSTMEKMLLGIANRPVSVKFDVEEIGEPK